MSGIEIEAVRSLLTSKPRPVGWAARRERLDEVGAAWPIEHDIVLEKVSAGGPPGEFSVAPGADRNRILLFFHGGGYCSGSIASHRRMVTEAGRAAGLRTLAIGYQLAPEHPYPAALDDALAAWEFLGTIGYDGGSVIVGGDSAGAGLSLALIQCLRSAGRRLPTAAWLVSPWTDLTLSGGALATRDAVDPLIHKAYLEELAAAYASEADRRNALLSPLFADLAGFPPLLIQVGSEETLLSDATRLAEAAGATRVDVTLEVWPNMIHAWPVWNARLEAGRQALSHFGLFARRHFRPQTERSP